MLYHLSEICRDVRIALRQNAQSHPLADIGDIDTLMLDELIASKVEEASRQVLVEAPLGDLEEGFPFDAEVVWQRMPAHRWGYVLLPDNYLRLVCFRMSDWNRAATIITQDDPRYRWQQSRFPGICGNPQNPIAVEVTYPIGRVLEFYSCGLESCAHVTHARYIPIPHLHPDDKTIHLPRRVYARMIERIVTSPPLSPLRGRTELLQ